MSSNNPPKSALHLLAVPIGLNYLAQVVYYLQLYYPRAPNWLGVGWLALTLIWFAVSWGLVYSGRNGGFWWLWSYLLAVGLFYLHTAVLSFVPGMGITAQLSNQHHLVQAVFAVGYINGLTALAYLVYLWRYRSAISTK